MDQDLFDIAHKLQKTLNEIDADADRASLSWAHGFLTGLLASLASRVPELADSEHVEKREDRAFATISELQRETSRILDSIDRTEQHETTLRGGEPNSLERLLDDLGESGPIETSGVPANRKPSPKGSSGGVALPLPTDTDYKM